MTSIPDVFGDKLIDKRQYAVDHFIPWSFVMNDAGLVRSLDIEFLLFHGPLL